MRHPTIFKSLVLPRKRVVSGESLCATCFWKCSALPIRKFLNSIRALPAPISVYQVDSFPTPLPIRIPFGLRDKGKCGKTKTQNDLFVMSAFREERFKKSFRRKTRLAVILNGLCRITPHLPYRNEGEVGNLIDLFF